MTTPPVLRARGLTRRFGPRPALEGVDLEIAPGEAVALLGGNGAGKTTLLRLAAGLLRPTAGSVEVLGKDPRRVPAVERASIGYLAHATLLYDDLTPLENLRLTASLYGLPDGEGRAREALSAMGLDGREDDPVRTLSRGLQQRAAVARALVHRPSLLLLDEPSAGLDAEGARRLSDAIRAAVAAGAAALLATHDAAFGREAAPRTLRLERGRTVEGS